MSSKELPDFVEKLLEPIIQKNGFIEYSMHSKSGSTAGDGFASELISIEITDNSGDRRMDVLCKIAPSNKNHRKDLSLEFLFRREALFYNKLMSTFARFQVEKKVPEEDQFLAYPKCYGTLIDDNEERYTIILEDLRPTGFKMWPKNEPSTIENMHLVMRELGKLHGLSIAMKDQKPNDFMAFSRVRDTIKTGLQSENMQTYLKQTLKRAIKSLENDAHKEIAQHIKDNLMAYMSDCLDVKPNNRFGVLCHGDAWNNNILYRFNENNVVESIRLVDYQFIQYGSPAIDLHFNIFTSTDKELRDKDYDNMLRWYYESLSKTVKALGSNSDVLFTFDDLKQELKQSGNILPVLVPMMLEVMQYDSNDVNLDDAFDKMAEGDHESGFRLSEQGQHEYVRRLNELFDDIVRLGYYRNIY